VAARTQAERAREATVAPRFLFWVAGWAVVSPLDLGARTRSEFRRKSEFIEGPGVCGNMEGGGQGTFWHQDMRCGESGRSRMMVLR
jgi:hypothetical protein